MKKISTLLYYVASALFLVAVCIVAINCSNKKHTYKIGVSQCSEDEWRDKLNSEIKMMSYIDESIDVVIKKTDDNNKMQIAQIDSLIDMGIDLLVVSPNEVDAVTPAVEKAYKKGIPVILYDRKIKSDCYNTFIGSNNYKMGYDLGKYIASKLGGKGSVAEIKGLKGSSPSIDRHRGFSDALKEYPGIRIIASEFGDWEQDSAETAMEKILKGGELPDYVFAHNDRMAYGAYQKAKASNKADKMKFVGIDGMLGNKQGIDLVCKGILDASYLNPTSGDEVIKLAKKILAGKKVNKENDLATTIITRDNAELTLMAAKNAERQREILEDLHSQVNKYEGYYEAQTLFVWLLGFLLFVVVIGSVFIYKSYLTKNRLSVQLTKKNQELERLNEEVIELTQSRLAFFTNVSHELRTPLTLILDPLERILSDKSISKPTMGLLNIVQRSAKTLKQLVDDIMDFRKIQNGKMKLKLSNFDLAAKLKSWVDDFYPSAEIRKINLMINTEAFTHSEVKADEDKLNRIVFNLVSNALKYTPASGTVTVSLSDAPGDRLKLSVKDTGRGISESEQKKVFDRFYQAQNSTGGTGIGLAVVKAYAELHNGEVTVESQLGKGTDFTVVIPCSQGNCLEGNIDNTNDNATEKKNCQPASAPVAEETPSAKSADAAGNNRERAKLLVIDDNKDIRDYISSTFANDYEIIEADNGKDGLEQALKYVPDIVVCDVMMPQMNGIEFCTALKQNTAICHIPIILLTAKTLDEQRVEGYEHGADSYITKPFNSKVLKARIDNLLNNRNTLANLFGKATGQSQNPAESEEHKDAEDKDATNGLSRMDNEFLNQLRSIIRSNMTNSDFGVEDISSKVGLSRVQLYRKVKAITGTSVVDLLRRARLQEAQKLLTDTNKSISEIAYEVGFSSPSYFTKCYKDEYDTLPGDARNS